MTKEEPIKATRDRHGNVLCCHGRPIQCHECGEEYAAELESPRQLVTEGAGGGAAPHWQPIETAPKDGTPVLVWTADVGQEGLTEFASVCSYHPDAGFCTHELMVATHWMPLPLPPSSTREE